MRRPLALSFMACTLACQVVTGDFAVSGGIDSGANVNDGRAGSDGSLDAAGSGSGSGGSGSSGGSSGSSSGSSGSSSGGPIDASGEGAGDVSQDGVADAALEAEAEAGLVCITDLSNVGAGDFHITFDVSTTSTATSTALVNQRTTPCSYSTYWDIRSASDGQIFVELDDGTVAGYSGYVVAGGPAVNDGQTHGVAVSRVSGTLSVAVDGATPATQAATQVLGALPPLEILKDDACGNAADGAATITNLCITRP